MTLLPVLDRELRVAARRSSTHWFRLAAGGAGFAGLALLLAFSTVPDSARGRQLYIAVSVIAMAYALVAGVLLTADAINGERTQGTLGLLFLTDLSARDILLGKLSATSVNGVYALIGVLPVLAVPLMFGGVTLGQVAGHSVLLIETLILSLAVGLHASTVCRDTGRAVGQGLLIMGAFVVVTLPALPFVLFRIPVLRQLALIGPVNAYLAFWPRRPGAIPWLDSVLALTLIPLAAWFFFRAAARRLHPVETEQQASAPEPCPIGPPGTPPIIGASSVRPRSGSPRFGSAPPPELLDSDPIMWLLWRQNRFPRADAALIKVLVAVGLVFTAAALLGEALW